MVTTTFSLTTRHHRRGVGRRRRGESSAQEGVEENGWEVEGMWGREQGKNRIPLIKILDAPLVEISRSNSLSWH